MTTLALAAKEPFKREETIEVAATVEAIYPESRLLVLNGAAGSSVIAAGPEVKNFAQIKVGDKVKVAYKAAMAAKITKSKEDAKTTVDAAAYTAPAGSMPAAAVGQTIKTTVQIESVDTSFETVSFKRPDGLVRTIAAGVARRKEVHPHAQEGRHGRRRVHRGAGHLGGAGRLSKTRS